MSEAVVIGILLKGLCIGLCHAPAQSGAGQVICPPVRNWTTQFQSQLAAELESAKSKKALTRVVGDAIQDRDIARACNLSKK